LETELQAELHPGHRISQAVDFQLYFSDEIRANGAIRKTEIAGAGVTVKGLGRRCRLWAAMRLKIVKGFQVLNGVEYCRTSGGRSWRPTYQWVAKGCRLAALDTLPIRILI
jgi:hypothetical protein